MALVTLRKDPNNPAFDSVDSTIMLKAEPVHYTCSSAKGHLSHCLIEASELELAGIKTEFLIDRSPHLIPWYRIDVH